MRHLWILALLFGCATQNPQQTVFQTATGYKAALTAAVTYKESPGASAVAVTKLQQADDVASPALKAAEATVRNPDFDKSATSAVVTAAKEALRVLMDVLTAFNIAVKPTQ